MKKRILSLILAAVMLATLSLFSVSAEGTTVSAGITKSSLPEYYVTEKSANCFPEAANTYLSSRDTGVATNPGYYATSSAATTLEFVGGTKEASGTATLTINDASGQYHLHWYFKSLPATDTKYLAFDVDTTGMTGGEYYHFAIQQGQADWGYLEFVPESVYYFKPVDGAREERKVSMNTHHDSFWMAPNEKGTVYIPETSLKTALGNPVDFETRFNSDQAWLMTAGDKTFGLIIENKIADEAANGDKIVFSNLRWVTEKPVSSTVPYNAEVITDDYSDTDDGYFSITAVNADSWQNYGDVFVNPFSDDFKAVRFNIDYSNFASSTRYMRIKYQGSRVLDDVSGTFEYSMNGTVYAVWDDGKVQELAASTSWENTISLPNGFKGTIVIPFTSFNNHDGNMLKDLDVTNSHINLHIGNDTQSAQTFTVDNVGFMTEYDANDIVAVRKNILGLGDSAIDFNGDGNIDILDLIRVKKFFI